MAKYKILVLPSDRTGVSKFRSVDPHLYLQKLYPDEFWIDIDYEPKLHNEEFLKKYDLIHYHRTLHPDYNLSKATVPILDKLGIPRNLGACCAGVREMIKDQCKCNPVIDVLLGRGEVGFINWN